MTEKNHPTICLSGKGQNTYWTGPTGKSQFHFSIPHCTQKLTNALIMNTIWWLISQGPQPRCNTRPPSADPKLNHIGWLGAPRRCDLILGQTGFTYPFYRETWQIECIEDLPCAKWHVDGSRVYRRGSMYILYRFMQVTQWSVLEFGLEDTFIQLDHDVVLTKSTVCANLLTQKINQNVKNGIHYKQPLGVSSSSHLEELSKKQKIFFTLF